MKGKSNRIRACGSDKVNVLAGNIIVLERFPEISREIWAHHLAYHLMDHPFTIGLAKAEHISLWVQPIPKIRAYNE